MNELTTQILELVSEGGAMAGWLYVATLLAELLLHGIWVLVLVFAIKASVKLTRELTGKTDEPVDPMVAQTTAISGLCARLSTLGQFPFSNRDEIAATLSRIDGQLVVLLHYLAPKGSDSE